MLKDGMHRYIRNFSWVLLHYRFSSNCFFGLIWVNKQIRLLIKVLIPLYLSCFYFQKKALFLLLTRLIAENVD